VKLGALIVGLAILAAVAWGASELHYRSCVNAAEARTPIVVTRPPKLDPLFEEPRQVVRGEAARRQAVHGCSRLPF
jgi:hypothetical protein